MIKAVGVMLIVVGLIGLLYGGLTYTRKTTVIDAGPVEITADDRERLPIPPIAGGVLLAAGFVLLLKRGN